MENLKDAPEESQEGEIQGKADVKSQSEQTDKKTSSTTDASDGKELEEELAKTKLAYSESSREAKRLVSKTKEMEEAYKDAKRQIDELNEYIDILESSKEKTEENEEDKNVDTSSKTEEDREENKEKKEKKHIPPRPSTELTEAMREAEEKKKWKKYYEEEKSIEAEAMKKLAEAKKKFPGMARASYRRRVEDKIKANMNLDILDACKEVDKDIELERAELEGGEPFVESGSGVKSSQRSTKVDPIIDHLMENSGNTGGLEGL